jgi:hypothetical protein
MSKTQPSNFPRMRCTLCDAHVKPHITWAADNEGQIHQVHVDAWCTYYWDTLAHRDEFCSATCVINWLTNKSVLP